MTTTITKHNYQVKKIEDIPRIVHEAFHLANTGRKGPVVIDFPKDMGVLKTDVELTKILIFLVMKLIVTQIKRILIS